MKLRFSALLFVACALVSKAYGQGAANAPATSTAPAKASPDQRTLPKALEPNVLMQITPSRGANVGDKITVKLDVTAPKGVDVTLPEPSLAPLELLDRRARREQAPDKEHFVFELDALALEPGSVTLPALTLRVVGPKGELGEVKTTPRALSIKSLIANEPDAKPKPATKPVVVMQDDYTIAWIAGGLLAIALIAGATLLISRWLSRRPKLAPAPPPPRPPWEVALEKLTQLERKKDQLLAAERGEEFIDGVSDALREYLGKRYGFEGLESTTDEVLKTLERLRPHKLSLSGVSLLLEQCDLVKFARATPDQEQCDDLWNGAVGLVRATIPVSTQPQSPASQEVAR